MRASILASTRQLTAKAAAASSQMPTVPATRVCHPGKPSVARNIPITAQNTASCVTRGSVRVQYCENRLGGLWMAVWVVIWVGLTLLRWGSAGRVELELHPVV